MAQEAREREFLYIDPSNRVEEERIETRPASALFKDVYRGSTVYLLQPRYVESELR